MKTRREIRRIALAVSVVLVAVALCAPAAGAAEPMPRLIGPKGKEVRGKWHRWLVQSRMPMVRGRVRLILGPCPGVARFAGCVFTRRPRRLYIRREARAQKAVLYHELGHTFDLLLLRHRDRRAFRRMMHLGKRGWFAGEAPPSELWAESYAMCSRFGLKRPPARKLGWTRSVYHYRPTRKQHRAVCELIVKAGGKKRQRSKPKPQPAPNAPPVLVEPEPAPQKPPPSSGPVPQLPTLPGLPRFPGSYQLPREV